MFKVMELLPIYDNYDRVVGQKFVQAHPMVYKTEGMANLTLSKILAEYGEDGWYPDYKVMRFDDASKRWEVVQPEYTRPVYDDDEIPF